MDGAEQLFCDSMVVDVKAHKQEKAMLHQQIGELTVTVKWLKKTVVMSLQERRKLVGCDLACQPIDEGGLNILK